MHLPTIHLHIREFHGKEYLFLDIPNDQDALTILRRIKARWSKQYQWWYIGVHDYPIYKLRGFFRGYELATDDLPEALCLKVDFSQAQLTFLRTFEKYLLGARYSSSTISTYLGWLNEFIFSIAGAVRKNWSYAMWIHSIRISFLLGGIRLAPNGSLLGR